MTILGQNLIIKGDLSIIISWKSLVFGIKPNNKERAGDESTFTCRGRERQLFEINRPIFTTMFKWCDQKL